MAGPTPRPWMYRQNPGHQKDNWTFHIDRQGTEGMMDWGVLIAACWGHVSESAEANAAIIVKAVNSHDKLTADREQLLAACKSIQAVIGVMFGRGEDAIVPESILTPIGVPLKIGEVMREADAAIKSAEAI